LEIAKNNHDVAVLIAIKKHFGGGYIKPKYNFIDVNECKNSRSVNRFILRDTKTIIIFVDSNPMLTRKQLDYLDWIGAPFLIKSSRVKKSRCTQDS
jgi:hypothetical protein